MADRGEALVFDGTSGLTCDVLLRNVRQTALLQGRQKDDEWIAQYCASRLEGLALRWYEELPLETQDSWRLLRREILLRWPEAAQDVPPMSPRATSPPRSPVRSSSFSSIGGMPTPAAAAPPPRNVASPLLNRVTSPNPGAELSFSVSSNSVISGKKKQGKIKIVSDEGVELGYVSPTLSSTGHLGTCQSFEEALAVEFYPSYEPHEVLLVADEDLGTYRTFIGATWAWYLNNPMSISRALLENVGGSTWVPSFLFARSPSISTKGSPSWGGVVFGNLDHSSNKLKSSAKVHAGETRRAVWQVLVDGTMLLTWTVKPGMRANLTMNLTIATQSLNFAFDHDAYVASAPSNWTKVRLIFQPL